MRRLVNSIGLLGLCGFVLAGCMTPPPNQTFPVFFTNLSSDLDPAAVGVVTSAAGVARQYPRYKVRVVGYANTVGSPDADIRLSKARADAVAAVLQQNGVTPDRIIRDAAGTPPNSQPGVESRRVEIDIVNP